MKTALPKASKQPQLQQNRKGVISRRGDGVVIKSFRGLNGTTEHFLSFTAPAALTFDQQLDAVGAAYAHGLRSIGLSPETAVFRRIFLSDVLNQGPRLKDSALGSDTPDNPVAISIVEQAPLPGRKIALLAHHIENAESLEKRRLSPHHMLLGGKGCRQLWTTGLCAGSRKKPVTAAAQTRLVFKDLMDGLAGQGATLRDHCVRTWLYMKDVDVFYQGMVDARRQLFERQGLTGDTHFIASTGIEGACGHQFDLIAMDAYSLPDLRPGQISYLNAFDHLCPTRDYNVTFERGTRIAYADRCHHFISGTASIDHKGKIVHPGNVLAQLDRTLENIDALLASGGAKIGQMMHFIVYLRDPADFPGVDAYFRSHFSDIPAVIVRGPVCRPGWLIEVEGIAVTPNNDPSLPQFTGSKST